MAFPNCQVTPLAQQHYPCLGTSFSTVGIPPARQAAAAFTRALFPHPHPITPFPWLFIWAPVSTSPATHTLFLFCAFVPSTTFQDMPSRTKHHPASLHCAVHVCAGFSSDVRRSIIPVYGDPARRRTTPTHTPLPTPRAPHPPPPGINTMGREPTTYILCSSSAWETNTAFSI